jgi:hypothetical protein
MASSRARRTVTDMSRQTATSCMRWRDQRATTIGGVAVQSRNRGGHRSTNGDVLRRRLTRMFQRDLDGIRTRLEAAGRARETPTRRPVASRQASFEPGGITGDEGHAAVDLYWLPLGAGGHCVRVYGRIFELFSARLQHRDPCDLYHSALEVQLGRSRYVIELAPVWNEHSTDRGVLAEGAVGHQQAGRFRRFRYEIRCWRDGRIPDVDEAVDSPRRLSSDPACARRILELVAHVPTAVWGRDELNTGEMWNSNSLISWLIASSGIETTSIHPPPGGRAPGWQAGLVLADRPSNPATAAPQSTPHLAHV